MPETNTSAITQKVWSMCGVLYDDGVSYGDYLEQNPLRFEDLENFKTMTEILESTNGAN